MWKIDAIFTADVSVRNMAAFWSFEKSGENEIYLSINGGRAVSIENVEDLGALQFIDYGRTSTELWVSKMLLTRGEGVVKCPSNVQLSLQYYHQSICIFYTIVSKKLLARETHRVIT